MAFRVFSSAFQDGGWLPELHSCQGADLSPSLEWVDPPHETMSFALTVEDPDAPGGIWCHWLLYDLGPKLRGLAQGYKAGTLGSSGTNDFGKLGYGGPCPPPGDAHRYFFKLHALNVHTLGLPKGVHRGELVHALEGHVLSEAQYMGRFQRK